MLVPWPPMNLVAEWMTMSAPHSIGRHRYGVANVLSTTSGSSRECAMAATVSMSSTFPAGNVRDGRHSLDVQHVPGRVADRLAEERLRVGAHRLPPRARIVGIDPRQLDRK